jgi:hypothetical protein
MLAREEEWRHREDYNDKEVESWAVEAPDGWGGTWPVSPIIEESWCKGNLTTPRGILHLDPAKGIPK